MAAVEATRQRRSLLRSVLEVHHCACDGREQCGCVGDAEGFVQAVLRQVHRGGSGPEGGQEADDLASFLIGELWLLSTRPLPGIWATRPFGAYAVWALHRRTTDWYRARYPGSRYGRALELVPLGGGEDPDDGNGGASGRATAEAVRRGDPVATNRIDLDALTETGRQTLLLLALPMTREGYSIAQLATRKTPLNGSEHPALQAAQRAAERRALQLAEQRAHIQARRDALDAGDDVLAQALASRRPARPEPAPPSRREIVESLLDELRDELLAQGLAPTVVGQ